MFYLPQLLTFITRRARYIPEFKWSHLWVHNIFRAYEYIFGRRFGIRAEMTSGFTWRNGKKIYFQQAHSLEAALTLVEVWLRNLKTFRLPVKIWLPVLSSPQGLSASPFLFAIAADANGAIGSTTGLSESWNHTVTGSNVILFANAQCTTNTLTTSTYNSVGSSGSFNLVITGTKVIKTYYFLAPATGTHSLTVNASPSSTMTGQSESYSGANQSAIDSNNTATSATSPTTVSTTVVASNCWLFWALGSVAAVSGAVTSSPGVNRGASGLSGFENDIGDSNGTVGTGSQSEVLTTPNSSQTAYGAILISFAPAATITASNLLPLLGIGT